MDCSMTNNIHSDRRPKFSPANPFGGAASAAYRLQIAAKPAHPSHRSHETCLFYKIKNLENTGNHLLLRTVPRILHEHEAHKYSIRHKHLNRSRFRKPPSQSPSTIIEKTSRLMGRQFPCAISCTKQYIFPYNTSC